MEVVEACFNIHLLMITLSMVSCLFEFVDFYFFATEKNEVLKKFGKQQLLLTVLFIPLQTISLVAVYQTSGLVLYRWTIRNTFSTNSNALGPTTLTTTRWESLWLTTKRIVVRLHLCLVATTVPPQFIQFTVIRIPSPEVNVIRPVFQATEAQVQIQDRLGKSPDSMA